MIGAPLSQIAYHVPDVRDAAARHARMFGSGPWFVAEGVDPPFVRHRGIETRWRHSSAFGQWGDLMVELLQQDDDAPSILHDVFPAGSGRYGLHHHAFIVDDPFVVADRLAAEGCPIALHVRLANGLEALMIDTIAVNGHVVELYAPSPPLIDIYAFIRTAAENWDGRDPVRSIVL